MVFSYVARHVGISGIDMGASTQYNRNMAVGELAQVYAFALGVGWGVGMFIAFLRSFLLSIYKTESNYKYE